MEKTKDADYKAGFSWGWDVEGKEPRGGQVPGAPPPHLLHWFKSGIGHLSWGPSRAPLLCRSLGPWKLVWQQMPTTLRKLSRLSPGPSSESLQRAAPYFWLLADHERPGPPSSQGNGWDSFNFKIRTVPMKQWVQFSHAFIRGLEYSTALVELGSRSTRFRRVGKELVSASSEGASSTETKLPQAFGTLGDWASAQKRI